MTSALATYFNMMSMNGCMQVYFQAKELGIFSFLEKNPSSLQEIVCSLNIKEAYTELLLNSLIAMGLLVKDRAMYSATPVTPLLSGAYSNLGNEYWQHLTNLIKTGQSLSINMNKVQSEAFYTSQVISLDWMMQPSAYLLSKYITLPKNATILDLGAGSGVWSNAVLQSNPKSNAVLVDRELVLNIARDFAKQRALLSRVTFMPADYKRYIPDTKFDLIIMGNISHLESDASLKSLISAYKSALSPSGSLLIVDVLNSSKKASLARSLYELGLVIRNSEVKLHTKREIKKILVSTGFNDVSYIPLNTPPYVMGAMITK